MTAGAFWIIIVIVTVFSFGMGTLFGWIVKDL